MSENIINVTDSNFESMVLESDTPALVDFWASWCAPCKAIAPLIEEMAGEYAGKVRVTKMNVDENPSTPGKFGVRGIPTLTDQGPYRQGAVSRGGLCVCGGDVAGDRAHRCMPTCTSAHEPPGRATRILIFKKRTGFACPFFYLYSINRDSGKNHENLSLH
jgi:thioredoxin 1